MSRVIRRDAALDDTDRIVHVIATHEDLAARCVAERLTACGESLRAFPRRGRPARHGRREMTIVPPDILRDQTDKETVLIRSIRQGARLPDPSA